jgi:hypothetical protein
MGSSSSVLSRVAPYVTRSRGVENESKFETKNDNVEYCKI